MSIVVPPVIGLAGLATGRRVRAASLLDLTFGRQILGNCWLCRASVIPKWARGATQRARFDYHKIVHETPCKVLRMME